MRNRAATWVNLVFASIIVVSVFVQAYFITAYVTGAGEDALDLHGFVGGLIIHGSELIVFLSALVAFWRMWGWIAVNFGLFVFGTIQIFLAPPDEDRASGWVHGLHGLFALFVLVYAAYIAHRDMRWLGLRGTPPGEPAVATRTADPV
ncbi:MAG TPA: hypothetical protein VHI12_03775 [Gaiellaceae bacterium]|jgi:hypothetical protein|nr:hypothetical protein [Gaiellaceae bacterium]